MEIGEKDIKNLSIIAIIALLLVLAFFLVKPMLSAIIGGLILAYVFTPVYKKLNNKTGYPSLSALIICVIIILIITVPLIFIIPKLMEQSFNIFSASQSIDFQYSIKTLFPAAEDEFIAKTSVAIDSLVNKAGTSILGSLTDMLFDIPLIALQIFIAAFVFFFALRDGGKFNEFMEGLSPFNKAKEGIFVRQFKDITDSIIYGIIIVGIFQGICAGLGFWIFRVPNTLFLTVLAVFFSLLPFIGPSIVWIPVNIFLFATASPGVAIAYLIYNIIIVSTIDNILRSYIVARKANISTVVILIGILGGAFVFGIMGLIIGPLILSYLITLLKAYKEKRIYSLFYGE